MKRKVFLLLVAGVLIFIGYVLVSVAIVFFKISSEPKPVEISEADFIKLLESHKIEPRRLAVAQLEGDGKISHSVVGDYKNPNPPGNDVPFETTSVDGPATKVEDVIKKYDDGFPPPRPRELTLARRLIRWLPVWVFLLVAWYLFRREVSLFVKRGLNYWFRGGRT